MTMWMPAQNEQTALAVSYAVYHLSQSPDMVDNTTEYAFPWREDASGAWWMEWPADMVLPVHPERQSELSDTLTAFVAAGQLAQASADAVLALAASRHGQTVTLMEVTPEEWVALMVDGATITWPDINEGDP